MNRPLRATLQIAGALAIAGAGLTIGERYIERLPDHRGRFLVAVDDAITTPPPVRPRHTVVVVVDGLGLEPARTLAATARLAAVGQCRVTDVGPISVSRPVYAVLSTGLEQDRTGARNNDETSPLAAESIWEVARAAGLDVSAASDVPWWRQLFPAGFDRYAVVPDHEDALATGPFGDLRLYHPAIVDHAGHDFGGASPQYAAAVARTDLELGRLLDRLDLARDLVVLTADHGHAPAGGHGGTDPQIARVLTCFAGRGVLHRTDAAPIHSHAIAGSLAVLLGLRFPKHMRALEDDLDEIFSIADPAHYPAAYLTNRRAAIDHHRQTNAAQIAAWLGQPGTWTDLYAAQHRRQQWRGAAVLLAILAVFTLAARRRRLDLRAALELALGCLAVFALTAALHIAWLGSLDWTAINLRERYLVRAPLICLIPALLAIAAHAVRHRDPARLAADQWTLAALALALDLGHIIVYGWPLGFPLPGPTVLLLPFLASFLTVVHALLAALLASLALVVRRGAPDLP